MLAKIRKLIYKLGFNPKPRSVFYSPSTALFLASRDSMTYFMKGYEQGYAEAVEWESVSKIAEQEDVMASEKPQEPVEAALALDYVTRVYDVYRASESPEWATVEPRVKKYCEYLFGSTKKE